jgi:hypothetical protein
VESLSHCYAVDGGKAHNDLVHEESILDPIKKILALVGLKMHQLGYSE